MKVNETRKINHFNKKIAKNPSLSLYCLLPLQIYRVAFKSIRKKSLVQFYNCSSTELYFNPGLSKFHQTVWISWGKTSLGKEKSRKVCFMKQDKHKCSTSSAVKLHRGHSAPEGYGACGSWMSNMVLESQYLHTTLLRGSTWESTVYSMII